MREFLDRYHEVPFRTRTIPEIAGLMGRHFRNPDREISEWDVLLNMWREAWQLYLPGFFDGFEIGGVEYTCSLCIVGVDELPHRSQLESQGQPASRHHKTRGAMVTRKTTARLGDEKEPQGRSQGLEFSIYVERDLCHDNGDATAIRDRLMQRTAIIATEYLCCVAAYFDCRQALVAGRSLADNLFPEHHPSVSDVGRLLCPNHHLLQSVRDHVLSRLAPGCTLKAAIDALIAGDSDTFAAFWDYWTDVRRTDPEIVAARLRILLLTTEEARS